MINFDHILYRYQQQTMNFHFSVAAGEKIAILGPSGAGKSTLLSLIAGFQFAESGTILLNNEDHTRTPPASRPVSMLFQENNLFAHLTAEQNIALGFHPGMKLNAAQKVQLEQIAEQVSLTPLLKRLPSQLSGGQRQRVALARALVMKPRILLLDEPLSALDAQIRKHLRQQIRQIQRELNLTTIFVTHDQEEAMLMSDRIFLMNKGEIVQSDTAENIYTQPANEFVARFMGHYNLVSAHNANSLLGLNLSGIVAIRPESIYVREAGRQYGEHISHPVSGTIRDSQLLGNIIRYQVDTGLGALTVDLLNRSSERLFEQGTQLELMFNKNEIRALAPSVN